MFEFEREVVIERPVEDVFVYLTSLDTIPDWAPKISRVEKTTPGPFGAGTELMEYAKLPLGRAQIHWEVLEFVPSRICTYASNSFMARGRVSFLLDEVDGGTRIKALVSGQLKGPFRVLEPLMAAIGRADRENSLRLIKERMESEVVGPSGQGGRRMEVK